MSGNQFHFTKYTEFLLNHAYTADHVLPILYVTIAILSIIVYKLGFARKLPLLKAMIIYIFLLFGDIILTILALQLPIVGALFFSAIVLVIYKIRLMQIKKKDNVNKEA